MIVVEYKQLAQELENLKIDKCSGTVKKRDGAGTYIASKWMVMMADNS